MSCMKEDGGQPLCRTLARVSFLPPPCRTEACLFAALLQVNNTSFLSVDAAIEGKFVVERG